MLGHATRASQFGTPSSGQERCGGKNTMSNKFLDLVKFNADGLVPVIAQQHDSGEVLMLAWMNLDAVSETTATGHLCYFSRSRERLWRKGEQSGQVQRLIELCVDCDGDTLLALVDQTGVACHTGRRSCFFTSMTKEGTTRVRQVLTEPEQLYG